MILQLRKKYAIQEIILEDDWSNSNGKLQYSTYVKVSTNVQVT